MLQQIRAHAGHWLIKVLLAGIVVSFAMWGITDIIRSLGTNRPVATVGKSSITMEEFQHAYKKALNNIQNMSKVQPTPEQIKEMKIDEHILDSLVVKHALEQELKRLKVVISDAAVKNEIHSIPVFLNKKGLFDKAAFDHIISSQGYSEPAFINELKTEMQQTQIAASLASGLGISEYYLKTLFQALDQQYQFVALDINFDKQKFTDKIDDSELQQFYTQNKEQFKKPEYRNITVLRFERPALMRHITVTDEEISQDYEKSMGSYTSEEKRTVEQLSFKSPSDAKKGVEQINLGKPLKAIARDLKCRHKNMGALTKSQIAIEYSHDVFEATVGTPTKIIENQEGWHIFVVTKIEESKKLTREEANGDILNRLKEEKFNVFFEEFQDKVQDDLAGGSDLQAIAQKYGLTLQTIPQVDKLGRNELGEKAIDETIKASVLDFTFGNGEGAESNVILASGSSGDLVAVLVKIKTINPTHIPEFSDIKGKVLDAYQQNKKNEGAYKKAQEIAKASTTVDMLMKQASMNKLTISNLPVISRATVDQQKSLRSELMPESLEAMFALKTSESLVAPTPKGYKIIMIQKILPFTFDKEKYNKFKEAMGQMTMRDFNQTYKLALKHYYPMTLNTEQYEHVTKH